MTSTQSNQIESAVKPPAALEVPVERVIRPAKRRLTLRHLVREASVINVLASRDFKIKYKQSLLGPLWLIFQPLALLAAFVIAFQELADVGSAGIPYVAFAMAGLSVWAFFQASMTIGTASVMANWGLVRFTPCPRPAFPIAAVIASLPSYVVTTTGAVIAAAVTGSISPKAVLLPFIGVWLLLLILGIVALTSAAAVRYRDVNSVLPFLLQLGLFVTPVGYALGDLSSTARLIVELNPLTGLIEATRWALLSGYESSVEPILISLIGTAVVAVGGWLYFTRRETTMADDI